MPLKPMQKQKIEAALNTLSHPADAPVAAALIVEAVLPRAENNPGATFYRLKAEGWLSLLLASEPGLSVDQLAARVMALAAISERIKGELGGLAGRLQGLVTQVA